MATTRGFSWGAFFAGAAALAVVGAVIAATVALGGLYPVAASRPDPSAVAWLLSESRERAVDRSAAGLKAPAFSRADIRLGAGHFKGMCQDCHGGPGVEPEEFAAGMNPHPPNLAKAAGDLSVEQVFWIEKNGLKMTGMPSFAKTDEDDELWKIAAFVKAMPKFSAVDYAGVPNAHEEEHENGHEMTGDKVGESH
jgi:mono/diheme cytochrome c family protein